MAVQGGYFLMLSISSLAAVSTMANAINKKTSVIE